MKNKDRKQSKANQFGWDTTLATLMVAGAAGFVAKRYTDAPVPEAAHGAPPADVEQEIEAGRAAPIELPENIILPDFGDAAASAAPTALPVALPQPLAELPLNIDWAHPQFKGDDGNEEMVQITAADEGPASDSFLPNEPPPLEAETEAKEEDAAGEEPDDQLEESEEENPSQNGEPAEGLESEDPPEPAPDPASEPDVSPLVHSGIGNLVVIPEGISVAEKLDDISFHDDALDSEGILLHEHAFLEIRNGNELWLREGFDFDFETGQRVYDVRLFSNAQPNVYQEFTLLIEDVDETPPGDDGFGGGGFGFDEGYDDGWYDDIGYDTFSGGGGPDII